MAYPPEGCTYEVRWRLGKRGQGVERFPDEYTMGRWFLEMEDLGAWDPADFVEGQAEFDGANGYQIWCVTPTERIGISYGHPRLVMGRIDHRKHLPAPSNT